MAESDGSFNGGSQTGYGSPFNPYMHKMDKLERKLRRMEMENERREKEEHERREREEVERRMREENERRVREEHERRIREEIERVRRENEENDLHSSHGGGSGSYYRHLMSQYFAHFNPLNCSLLMLPRV